MPDPLLERWFPNLKASGYRVSSEATPDYNCIAWAAGESVQWWWPDAADDYFWTAPVPREATLENFVLAFEGMGYQTCDSAGTEPQFEKVAICVGTDGVPTHAARQIASGAWISKLGEAQDIEHDSLSAVEGDFYGTVARILKRPRS